MVESNEGDNWVCAVSIDIPDPDLMMTRVNIFTNNVATDAQFSQVIGSSG